MLVVLGVFEDLMSPMVVKSSKTLCFECLSILDNGGQQQNLIVSPFVIYQGDFSHPLPIGLDRICMHLLKVDNTLAAVVKLKLMIY